MPTLFKWQRVKSKFIFAVWLYRYLGLFALGISSVQEARTPKSVCNIVCYVFSELASGQAGQNSNRGYMKQFIRTVAIRGGPKEI